MYRLVGRIGEMQAFAREGCALTFFRWSDDEWRIFGGFSEKKLQTAVGKELGLYWEEL